MACYDDAFNKVMAPRDATIIHHDHGSGSVFIGILSTPSSPPDRSEARSTTASWPATTNRPARSRAAVAATPGKAPTWMPDPDQEPQIQAAK